MHDSWLTHRVVEGIEVVMADTVVALASQGTCYTACT